MLAVLGFDSAGLTLLEGLLADGRLPALADLRRRGAWRTLESPATLLAAATYPTLYTGVEPGEHGHYYPFQWSAGEQRVRPASAFAGPDAIWDRLARAGRRSLVVDPYEARPPRLAAGTFVSGWQFVNRVVLKPWSEPREARAQLARRFGRPREIDEVFGRPTARGLARLLERATAAPGRVVDAALDLLSRERFDLVWLGFPVAHLSGHQFWDLSQVAPGELERARQLGFDTALERVYEAVDEAIGRLVAVLPDDADIIVLSPLGMGPNTSRVDLLPGMLDAVLADGRRHHQPPPADSFLWRLRSGVPTDLRARVARMLPDEAVLGLTARLSTRGVDWAGTRAFTLPADHNGHIRLNLRGRERNGIVDPGTRDALIEEIVAGLLSFDDEGGGSAVAGVELAAERYTGARAGLLPDLIVRWADVPASGLQGVRSPRFGSVARAGVGSGRSGNHTGDAWALLVPGSSRLRDPARPPKLVDVAATTAAVLGADPDGLAGEPLLEP